MRPDFPQARENLGVLLYQRGRFEEAERELREAIRLEPQNPWPHLNLGKLFRTSDRLDEAEACYRQAIGLDLANPHPWNLLGSCLRELGRIEEAIGAFREALSRKPDFREAHSNLCYDLHFDPRATPRQILRETIEWDRKFAAPLADRIRPHDDHDRDPSAGQHVGTRRLRVGFVSPDFRQHVVGQNILPMFRSHDHGRFEIFCYSNAPVPDLMTDEFRGYADQWRDIRPLSDDQAAGLIRADKIDILVDLTLHMVDNRLLVFARKPAPIQVTFAGYPSTTGLSRMDYRLTDTHMDPPSMDSGQAPGTHDEDYREKSIRFSGCFWCYAPLGEQPPLNQPPVVRNGFVTFGCTNTFAKTNEPTIDLWVPVLAAVPSSRLLVLAPKGSCRVRFTESFRRRGIDPSRINFLDRQPQLGYLRMYHQIDINLDPLPYPGHTTTMDSLWMGVPVVNLPGQLAVSRGGVSILSTAGLPELIATNPQDFVRIAASLAADIPWLAHLRRTMRDRLLSSPLMDGRRFATNLEAAYRLMWQNWCANR